MPGRRGLGLWVNNFPPFKYLSIKYRPPTLSNFLRWQYLIWKLQKIVLKGNLLLVYIVPVKKYFEAKART